MADIDLPDEDKAAIKAGLLAWRTEGNDNPMLPVNLDLNGDGVSDAYGLDENDELVVIPGVPVEETVYESEGDDIDPQDGE